MCLSDLNRKIYKLLKELEDLDDEILFGSARKSLDELLEEEKTLLANLKELYLLELEELYEGSLVVDFDSKSQQINRRVDEYNES